jgi:iron complex transport system substrate-binding protein
MPGLVSPPVLGQRAQTKSARSIAKGEVNHSPRGHDQVKQDAPREKIYVFLEEMGLDTGAAAEEADKERARVLPRYGDPAKPMCRRRTSNIIFRLALSSRPVHGATLTKRERAIRHLLIFMAICVCTAAFEAAAAVAKPARPNRIVSLNLCADQYLLALADHNQIASLTRFARDPQMSAGASAAAGLPTSRGSAEDVLALKPDLLLVSPGRRSTTRAALKSQHYATLELPSAASYNDIVRQIREVASAVGHPDRGEALIRRMDASLAALPIARNKGVAAYYQRRGYLTGAGTLVDELITRTGLVNLATKIGKPALSRVSLEEMTAARPDYIIVENATDKVSDLGTEMLHHPMLDGIRRLSLPQAWTVCGGPAYVLAAQSLSRQLNAR